MTGTENETTKIRIPRQERGIKTKEAILQAAMKLFSEKGYHGTNTKEIAAAAGVSTGSFYSYYKDKRAVFLDSLSIYFSTLLERIETYLAGINFSTMDKHEMIREVIDSLIYSHQVFTGFHKELQVMYHSDPEVQLIMDEQFDLGRRKTLEYLLMNSEELKVDHAEAASIVMFEAINSVVDMLVFSQQKVDDNLIKNELAKMIVSYLYH
ncbi:MULTISPECIES: TetR/AcrR family transcriptional regulator [Paenibacillus]|uniref:AcrR family transcriptional regulator n=1 Tax=Paenibacillus albilobatus TaxID=2716884 RepID=A0A920C871_9BACL|nr:MULTISPECIES: TetR/AcrR family transcriptional regulator [Paenibacillus]GIO29786.1 AcrR family transcriptional regulator [Paenibacillus albilobatus]